MSFDYDESGWPLVFASWRGVPSDEEFANALARIDIWLARGERFGLLIDARGGGGFSPEQRRQLIAHMKHNIERTERFLVQATVIDNLVQRTLFYGVNLLFPNRFPSKVFADVESAREWLARTLGTEAPNPRSDARPVGPEPPGPAGPHGAG